MKLRLISLTGEKLNQDVYQVQIPTASGEISVYDTHESLTSIAIPGTLLVRVNKEDRDEDQEVFAIDGGAIMVENNELKVLVDEAESAEEITAAEAEAALNRAQKLRANAKDSVSISEAEAMMNRASVRLKVAGLRRRRNR